MEDWFLIRKNEVDQDIEYGQDIQIKEFVLTVKGNIKGINTCW